MRLYDLFERLKLVSKRLYLARFLKHLKFVLLNNLGPHSLVLLIQALHSLCNDIGRE